MPPGRTGSRTVFHDSFRLLRTETRKIPRITGAQIDTGNSGTVDPAWYDSSSISNASHYATSGIDPTPRAYGTWARVSVRARTCHAAYRNPLLNPPPRPLAPPPFPNTVTNRHPNRPTPGPPNMLPQGSPRLCRVVLGFGGVGVGSVGGLSRPY